MGEKINKVITPMELLNDLINSGGDLASYGYHKEIMVGGKKCVAIIIGDHRYLVAVENVISGVCWYPNDTDNLDDIVPYTRGVQDTISLALENPIVNFSDYYELDRLTQNIITVGALHNITTPFAAKSVRDLNLGGLRWNLPNFEVLYYMFLNYDVFFDPTGTYKLGNNFFWLPYRGISPAVPQGGWFFRVNSSTSTYLSFHSITMSYRALPVTTF